MFRTIQMGLNNLHRSFSQRFNYNLKFHEEPILGRWKLKHCEDKCNDYITNYYGDPGYPNYSKNEWTTKLSDTDTIDKY